jgi:hypothetical protein
MAKIVFNEKWFLRKGSSTVRGRTRAVKIYAKNAASFKAYKALQSVPGKHLRPTLPSGRPIVLSVKYV